MHPAFSVIVFSTLSGAGYGLWFWMAVSLLVSPGGHAALAAHALGLALGFVLVTFGLLSSLAHLGRPERAWRALSQWRSSWLSREGVAAVLTYLPLLALAVLFTLRAPAVVTAGPWLLAALALGSLVTVGCTAMIYASLKPIPAWRHAAVVPVYLGFALLSGGLIAVTLLAAFDEAPSNRVGLALALGALGLGALKLRYWRGIDRDSGMPAAAAALGLSAGGTVHAWESPHTEANYLTREMGFVLARRHGRRLRLLALLLFAGLPALLALPQYLLPHVDAALVAVLLAFASVCALLGALLERWLFFAQARHVVSVYYQGDRAD